MDGNSALPGWLVILLIIVGIALTVGFSLVLTQLDSLQQRSLLPQATLPVIDGDATMAAVEVTVVVLEADGVASATAETEIAATATLAQQVTIALEPTVTVTPTTAETMTPEVLETLTLAATSAFTATPTVQTTPGLAAVCATAPAGWTVYIAGEFDNLTSLAIEFDISVEQLRQANCLAEEEQIRPGQAVLVPPEKQLSVPESQGACTPPSGWELYAVSTGDTLIGLAKKSRTSVHELIGANCLTTIALSFGQELYIPPVAGWNPMTQTQPDLPMKKTRVWKPGTSP